MSEEMETKSTELSDRIIVIRILLKDLKFV